ncbi:hypothetical protein BVRB_030320 [Beta vulgaris subsp. vulgaris]|uniref:Uncharacterized protein n=1 Tax=Beta vulgaris subsp. vulgaris TaxID=3555 RepID=A0A0J8B0V9_BETVV|nr:hypothetical protein BVRB_030320 [Beta vulgaris subsp. vulgaris]
MSHLETDDIRPDSEPSPRPEDAERPLRPSELQLYRLKQADNDERPSASADLFSALIRLPPILPAQHGKPTCIALQARYVAIGTTSGSVVMSPLAGVPAAMLFDNDQSRNVSKLIPKPAP